MTSDATRSGVDGADMGHAEGGTRIEAGAVLRRAAALGVARAGPHLVVREPHAGERVVALTASCTVGRGRAAVLQLDDPSASRVHLRVQLDEAGAAVEDLGSRNGLRVNGRRTRGLCRLRSGDELAVGETQLRYVDPLEAVDASRPRAGASGRRHAGEALLLAAGLLALAAVVLAW